MNPVFLSFDVGVRNLAVCKAEVHVIGGAPGGGAPGGEAPQWTIHHWDVLDVLKDVATTTKPGIPETAQYLLDTLRQQQDVLLQNPAPTAVLIEQQPGGKFVNVSMKALSQVLQAFFYLQAPTVPIYFVSARKKLQTADSHEKGTEQKKRYRSNKQFSTNTVLELLQTSVQNPEAALSIFNSRSKKDDLADSLLQAVAYFTSTQKQKAPKKRQRTKK